MLWLAATLRARNKLIKQPHSRFYNAKSRAEGLNNKGLEVRMVKIKQFSAKMPNALHIYS